MGDDVVGMIGAGVEFKVDAGCCSPLWCWTGTEDTVGASAGPGFLFRCYYRCMCLAAKLRNNVYRWVVSKRFKKITPD